MGKPVVPRRDGQQGKTWTEDEALDWYARARAHVRRRVKKREMGDYHRIFARLFGSVPAFQARGGDEPGRRGRPKTMQEGDA